MSDHKPVTAEELAEVAKLDVSECSGISAGWCPVHGDCTCPRDSTDTREEQSDDCPLHGTFSNHGDDEGEPPQIARSLVMRLARDLATARASIQGLIESLNAAQTDRDAIGDRCLDLGRELEALRAAVRAHRAAHEAGEGETVALVRLYQLAEKA